MTRLRRPCENCPWRVDAPRTYWDPQHFLDIWKNCQDDGMSLMGCHKSTEAKQLPCQGWARVMGFDAIGVRLAAMRGLLSIDEINDTKGPKLFRDMAEMLKANKIKLPKRNRWVAADD